MSQKRTRQNISQKRAASHAKQGSAAHASSRHATQGSPIHAESFSSRVTQEPGYDINVPGVGEFSITRRQFFYGVAGVAALAVLGGGGYAISELTQGQDGLSTLTVPENAVFTSEDCTLIENSANAMALITSQKLPYGSLLWCNDDNVAACLLPTDTARPLTQIGLFSLTAGTHYVVRKQAVGQDEGFEIYDVRACPKGMIWVEADILANTWRVYQTTLTELTPGEPVLMEEGGGDWEMPTLAAVEDYAFWQVIPRLDGEATTEDSKLKRAKFGSNTVEDAYVSHGRMATAPYATHTSVVITPRANTSGTYYQLTNIDANSGEILDAITLPRAMKPFEAGYGDTGFSFAFEAIYNYGGGIANLGTYTSASDATYTPPADDGKAKEEPSTEDTATSISSASTSNHSSTDWFRFPRTPLAAPAWCGSWFMVKSTAAVCGVNFDTKEYFTLSVEDGIDDYGDYLASTGSGKRVVTFSNIDYTPIEGGNEKYCLVRVWEALS